MVVEAGQPQLREGVIVCRLAFGGAFVVDVAQLTAVEIDDNLADVLTAESTPKAPLSPALAEEIRRGLADGWLTTEHTAGDVA